MSGTRNQPYPDFETKSGCSSRFPLVFVAAVGYPANAVDVVDGEAGGLDRHQDRLDRDTNGRRLRRPADLSVHGAAGETPTGREADWPHPLVLTDDGICREREGEGEPGGFAEHSEGAVRVVRHLEEVAHATDESAAPKREIGGIGATFRRQQRLSARTPQQEYLRLRAGIAFQP